MDHQGIPNGVGSLGLRKPVRGPSSLSAALGAWEVGCSQDWGTLTDGGPEGTQPPGVQGLPPGARWIPPSPRAGPRFPAAELEPWWASSSWQEGVMPESRIFLVLDLFPVSYLFRCGQLQWANRAC